MWCLNQLELSSFSVMLRIHKPTLTISPNKHAQHASIPESAESSNVSSMSRSSLRAFKALESSRARITWFCNTPLSTFSRHIFNSVRWSVKFTQNKGATFSGETGGRRLWEFSHTVALKARRKNFQMNKIRRHSVFRRIVFHKSCFSLTLSIFSSWYNSLFLLFSSLCRADFV